MMLPVAVMSLAMLVSYQRAKAESLGYDAKGGIMERAERFIVLAFGLLFTELLVWTLWFMLVLTGVTAVQRFVKVWRQASADRPVRPRSRRRFRRTAPKQNGRTPHRVHLAGPADSAPSSVERPSRDHSPDRVWGNGAGGVRDTRHRGVFGRLRPSPASSGA